MRDRFTVVRIPPASLPEQVSSGTVQKGCGSETAVCLQRFCSSRRREPRTRRRRCAWSCATSTRRRHARSRPRRSGSTWSGCTGRAAARRRSACAGSHGWSAWQQADDDWGRSGVWRKSNAVWTGTASAIQIRTRGDVTHVREYLLWSPPVHEHGPDASDHGLADDRDAHRLARGGGDPPRQAALRAVAAVRARAPHGHGERVLVQPVGVDRARHRGLPRAGKRLGRHRLQLSRRRVRPGVRRPLRRDHEERRRRALAGFNTGSVGVALIGNYSKTRTVEGRAGRAREAARVAPRRRARRSVRNGRLQVRRQLEVSARARA